MNDLLEIRGVDAGYGPIKVLKQINLKVAEHAITALIGSNGAGKSTTMRTVSGLLSAQSGQILFAGRDITSDSTSARVAKGLTLVPEGRLVFPDFTIEETLMIGAYTPHARVGASERKEEIYDLFPRLRERHKTRAGSLSGGEQQMLALGRGLMSVPKLLLLDEPSLGLAPGVAEEMFAAVLRIKSKGISVFVVEQDVQSTLQIADYGYVMENGVITAEGPARELRDSPVVRQSYFGL